MALIRSRNWRTVYRLDWTAQGSQDVRTNQAYTVDGRTWTTENGTNSTSFDVTNGTGLVFVSASGNASNYANNTRTATLFRADLSSLIPGLNNNMAIRIMSRVLLTSADTNFELAKVGLENGESAAIATINHAVMARGFNSAANTMQSQYTWFSTASTFDGADVRAHDVMVLVYRPPFTVDFYSGLFGSDFPDERSLTYKSSFVPGRPSAVTTTGNSLRSTNLRYLFNAAGAGAASTFTATMTHTRFDVMDL